MVTLEVVETNYLTGLHDCKTQLLESYFK